MKQRKYSKGQIVRIPQEAKAGIPVVELVLKYSFSQNAYIKRFNRSYREVVLDAYVFHSLAGIRQVTAD